MKLNNINYNKYSAMLLLSLCLCMPLKAASGIGGFLHKVGAFIDKSTVKGIDTTYIGVPEKPWQFMVRGFSDYATIHMNSHLFSDDNVFSFDWEPSIKTGFSNLYGVWVGYRGYGIGFSYNPRPNKRSEKGFSLSLGGSQYGLSLKINRFKNTEASVKLTDFDNKEGEPYFGDITLDDPMSIKTVLVDAYYELNGKHYSNTASYDQSVIQLRSAGSPLIALSWFQGEVDYASNKNALFLTLMNDVGKFKFSQACIGAGYAYNWIPWPNRVSSKPRLKQGRLLVNAMAAPMLSVYNRVKTWLYDYDFESDIENAAIKEKGTETFHSRLAVNFTARLAVVYNLDPWFGVANAQFNRYGYKHQPIDSDLTFWNFSASIGYRF